MSTKIRQDINIGHNIRKYRIASHLTQEQVVAKLQLREIEISRSAYSQIECGTYNIRVTELLALVDLFKVPVSVFFTNLSTDSDSNKNNENNQLID